MRKVSTALLAPESLAHKRDGDQRAQHHRDGGGHRGDVDAQLHRVGQCRVLERVGPVVEREALPGVVELALRVVEREQHDHEDRQEQVQQHQPGDDAQQEVAPFRAALDGFRLGSRADGGGDRGACLRRHTRSSVPSARV